MLHQSATHGKILQFPILSKILKQFYNVKILVIEDEQQLMDSIKESLEKEGFLVETASDYHSAIHQVFDYDYDCILLDIMLHNYSGLDILNELKKNERTKTLLLFQPKIRWMIN